MAKPRKGYGVDDITSTELNLVGNFVLDGLRHVIEKSIDKSKYPNTWKLSKVKTIFKKGSQLDRGNYRPISLLSIPGKVPENIIADEIDRHFLQNPGIYNEHQWGFKKGRSQELLMLHLTETWKEALDQEKTVGVLFIDFKKAFDSVCHKTLNIKMQACGISGNLLNWLNDYLQLITADSLLK